MPINVISPFIEPRLFIQVTRMLKRSQYSSNNSSAVTIMFELYRGTQLASFDSHFIKSNFLQCSKANMPSVED